LFKKKLLPFGFFNLDLGIIESVVFLLCGSGGGIVGGDFLVEVGNV
jgi:hypothetical protein